MPAPATGVPGAEVAHAVPVVAGLTLPFGLDAAAFAELRRRIEETTGSTRSIAAQYGIPPGSLARFIAGEGWTRPPGAPKAPGGRRQGGRRLAATIADAGLVTARLLRAVDRQIGKIETRLKKKGAMVEEKDARILGHLGRTLATLMALENGASAKEPEPADRAELTARLADRIARWAARQGDDS
jgi:hypothetical protein